MKKQDIITRHDIYFLVKEFYKKVNKNEHISVFFKHIKDWDAHIETITTFWESSLFLQTKYYGDPLKAHVKVDAIYNHKIKEFHFGIWLNLWFETINEYFEGDIAENAKQRARKMSTFMFMKIFESRV